MRFLTGTIRGAVLFITSFMCMWAVQTDELAASERYALVIGNGNYETTSPLKNPPNDARLMAETLTGVGFSVTVLIDASQREMRKAMLEFGRVLRSGDVKAGLFYYAGHGVQVKGENYLIPVTAQIQAEDEIDLEGINVNDFLQVMETSESDINIVILDACRNNPFARSFRSSVSGLATVNAPTGTLIAYSTAPGKVALDGGGSNSPYTAALTHSISQFGNQSIESVFKETRKRVLEHTGDRQTSWETSSVVGEFFFRSGSNSTSVELPDNSASGPEKVETLVEAFERARQDGSENAWRDFLDRHGADQNNFYVQSARQQLAALVTPAPVERRPERRSFYIPGYTWLQVKSSRTDSLDTMIAIAQTYRHGSRGVRFPDVRVFQTDLGYAVAVAHGPKREIEKLRVKWKKSGAIPADSFPRLGKKYIREIVVD